MKFKQQLSLNHYATKIIKWKILILIHHKDFQFDMTAAKNVEDISLIIIDILIV